MKKSILLFLLVELCVNCFSQEPGCNIGKSLVTMKQEFPDLRYVKTDSKGDEYEDGYPQDGIAFFFYFKNGYVIEECMICQSNDGFPYMWYGSLVKSFTKKYNYALVANEMNYKKFMFSYFYVNIIYVSENGKNTALVVYEKR